MTPETNRNRAAAARVKRIGRGHPRGPGPRGGPGLLDNIFIDRLWRSLKYEAVYLHEFRDGLDAERIIGSWCDFYNEARPHSSLLGRTPEEFFRTVPGCYHMPYAI